MPALSVMSAFCVLAVTTSLTHARVMSSRTADGGSVVDTFTYPQCQTYLESVEYSETPVLSNVGCTNPRKSFLSLNTSAIGPGCIVAVFADLQCSQPVNTQVNGSCVSLYADGFLGALLAYEIYGCIGAPSSHPQSISTSSGTSSSSISATPTSSTWSSLATSVLNTLSTVTSGTVLKSVGNNAATLSSSPESNSQSGSNDNNGNSASSDRATIAGTVIGSVLGTAALVVTVYFGLVARRRYDRQHKYDHDQSPSRATSVHQSIVR